MTKPIRLITDEFRQQAVDLLLSSGRPVKAVAQELGIGAKSLQRWRDKALGNGRVAKAEPAQPGGRSEAPIADAAGEIRRLQREVEYLRRQREILKKAMSILAEDPLSGMP